MQISVHLSFGKSWEKYYWDMMPKMRSHFKPPLAQFLPVWPVSASTIPNRKDGRAFIQILFYFLFPLLSQSSFLAYYAGWNLTLGISTFTHIKQLHKISTSAKHSKMIFSSTEINMEDNLNKNCSQFISQFLSCSSCATII